METTTSTKNWYALYTRPRWEKKVAVTIELMRLEAYCPLHRVMKQWSDRKKLVSEPLFSSYVFVKATEKELTLVKGADGVVNVVNWLGKPAVIKEKEIELIRQFLNHHTIIDIERTNIKINDTVRILRGPLMENKGTILMVKNKHVKVLLPSLGYIITVEVKKEDVELVSQSDTA